MFRGEYGICTWCKEEAEKLNVEPSKKWIVIKKPYLCNYHNKMRLQGKKNQISKITKSSVKKASTIKPKFKKTTGEWEMFQEIWKEKPHRCENCRTNLGDRPKPVFFSHIITKGSRPDLRLHKDNIELLCAKCHHKWEVGDIAAKKRFKFSPVKKELIRKENYMLYCKLFGDE